MRTEYALILSFQGISLAERSDGAWAELGRVALSAPDLNAELSALRDLAARQSGAPVAVRLVLPNEQIRYMKLPADQGSQDAVLAALDGATPYALADLAFDFETDASGTHVAAVARETLEEAREFAVDNGFAPIAYVAVAPDNQFEREVFFGLAEGAEALWPSAIPVGPADTPVIMGARPAHPPEVEPEAEAEPAPEESTSTADTAPPKQAADDNGSASPDDLPSAPEGADESPQTETTAPVAEPEKTLQPAKVVSAHRITKLAPAVDPSASATPEPFEPAQPSPLPEAAPLFASRNRAGPAQSAATSKPERKEPSFARKDRGKTPEPAAPKAAKPSAPAKPAKEAPAPKTAEPLAAESLSPDAMDAAASLQPAAAAEPPLLTPHARAANRNWWMPVGAALSAALVIGAGIWIFGGSRGDTIDPTQPQPTAVVAQPAPTPQASPPPAATTPPVTGTILTLEEAQRRYAATGVWQRAPGTPEPGRARDAVPTTPQAAEAAPAVSTRSVLPAQTALLSDAAPAQPSPPPPRDMRFVLDENGFIQATPEGAITPLGARVFAGRPEVTPPIRPGTQTPTATAEPAADQPQPSATPPAVEQPAAPQITTPSGVVVIPGQPPVSPPTRPSTAPAVSAAEAPPLAVPTPEAPPAETGSTTGVTIIQGRPDPVPPARPGTIPPIATQQDAALAPATTAPTASTAGVLQLAGLRPRLRPATITAPPPPPVDPFASASELAVASALEPRIRPGNMARIVEQARAAQPTQRATAVPVTAATIRTVAPAGAVNGTVATRATQEGVLALNRTALIGVFGSSSNRRALVRLANGSIVRVSIGDRLDGGRVAAIGTSDLTYTRSGRSIRLAMP